MKLTRNCKMVGLAMETKFLLLNSQRYAHKSNIIRHFFIYIRRNSATNMKLSHYKLVFKCLVSQRRVTSKLSAFSATHYLFKSYVFFTLYFSDSCGILRMSIGKERWRSRMVPSRQDGRSISRCCFRYTSWSHQCTIQVHVRLSLLLFDQFFYQYKYQNVISSLVNRHGYHIILSEGRKN